VQTMLTVLTQIPHFVSGSRCYGGSHRELAGEPPPLERLPLGCECPVSLLKARRVGFSFVKRPLVMSDIIL
jgi:hypothetical protein